MMGFEDPPPKRIERIDGLVLDVSQERHELAWPLDVPLKRFGGIPLDVTRLVFAFLSPQDWSSSCAGVDQQFNHLSKQMWNRLHVWIFRGLPPRGTEFETNRAEMIGKYATNLETLFIHNTRLSLYGLSFLISNLHQLRQLYLECSPHILETISSDSYISVKSLARLQVLRLVGINMNIPPSRFTELIENSYESLESIIIRRKDPTRCHGPSCGAYTLWKFRMCSGCKIVTYCSRRCQKHHWKLHRQVCQSYQNQPKQRPKLLEGFLPAIIQCKQLRRLDLSWTFRMSNKCLQTITKHCPFLENVALDGNHDITDDGVRYLAEGLENLQMLHLSNCRHVGNGTIDALVTYRSETLIDLDLGCCPMIQETALMDLFENCTKLKSLNIACGFLHTVIFWNFTDELAERILDFMPELQFLYVVSTIALSPEIRQRLMSKPDLRVFCALSVQPSSNTREIERT